MEVTVTSATEAAKVQLNAGALKETNFPCRSEQFIEATRVAEPLPLVIMSRPREPLHSPWPLQHQADPWPRRLQPSTSPEDGTVLHLEECRRSLPSPPRGAFGTGRSAGPRREGRAAGSRLCRLPTTRLARKARKARPTWVLGEAAIVAAAANHPASC